MFSKMLKTTAVSIIAAGALAGSAQASVIDTDDVRLLSTGYDFGGSTWGIGSPTGDGEIHFHHESGGIRPHVLGTLHVNDADGTCSRMRLRVLQRHRHAGAGAFGGTVCVTDDAHHAFRSTSTRTRTRDRQRAGSRAEADRVGEFVAARRPTGRTRTATT